MINKDKEKYLLLNFMIGNGIKIVKKLGEKIFVSRIRIRMVETKNDNNK